MGLAGAVEALTQAVRRNAGEITPLLERYEARQALATRYVAAYRRYCWPVHSIADLKLAPFHLLATEGAVHTDKDHHWQMTTLAELCQAAPDLLLATAYKLVDVSDEASQEAGINWWKELTAHGGEGMVVKPLDFISQGRRGLAQPAVKC